MPRVVWLPLLTLSLAGCAIHMAPPSVEQMRLDASALADAKQALESLGLQEFEDLDWCKALVYSRGAFTTKLGANHLCIAADSPVAFDDQAVADFTRTKEILSSTGIGVMSVETWERPECGMEWQFHVEAGAFDRFAFVYCRNAQVPESSGDSVYTTINDDWYFWNEDWN